jgi:hypothetical protein
MAGDFLSDTKEIRHRARSHPARTAGRATVTKARRGGRKIEKVMGEYKRGTLRSSSGRKVHKRKQAVAIALSEARSAGARIPRRRRPTRGR